MCKSNPDYKSKSSTFQKHQSTVNVSEDIEDIYVSWAGKAYITILKELLQAFSCPSCFESSTVEDTSIISENTVGLVKCSNCGHTTVMQKCPGNVSLFYICTVQCRLPCGKGLMSSGKYEHASITKLVKKYKKWGKLHIQLLEFVSTITKAVSEELSQW